MLAGDWGGGVGTWGRWLLNLLRGCGSVGSSFRIDMRLDFFGGAGGKRGACCDMADTGTELGRLFSS